MTMTLVNWQALTANQKRQVGERLVDLYQNRAWGKPITQTVATKNLNRQGNYLVVDQVGTGQATRFDAAFLGGVRTNETVDGTVASLYVVFEPIVRTSVADKKAKLLELARFTVQQARGRGVTEVIWCFPDDSPIGAWLNERGVRSRTAFMDGVRAVVYEEPADGLEAKL